MFLPREARFLALDPHGYALAIEALLGAELEGVLAGVRCPCLVLAGRHDGAWPPEVVRALAARIPGARFELVEAWHLMPVQMPGELARRVGAFLPG